MLANDLLEISNLIIADYERLGILQLLKDGMVLAENRFKINDVEYTSNAQSIRERARYILDQEGVRHFPLAIRRILDGSQFSSILPANIAKTILAGFPDHKLQAISSGELKMYQTEAQASLALLAKYSDLAQRFRIERYLSPEGSIAFELRFPRSTFNDNLGNLGDKFEKWNNFIAAVAELTTGSRTGGQIISLSTSDLLVVLAASGPIIYGILELYSQFLDVVEKQINVYKAMRELKNSGLPSEQIAITNENLQRVINAATENAVDKALEKIDSKLPVQRVNEVKIEFKKSATYIISDISSGVRIDSRISTIDQMAIVAGTSNEESVKQIREMIEDQRALGSQLDVELRTGNQPLEINAIPRT